MGAHARGVAYVAIAVGLDNPSEVNAIAGESNWQLNQTSLKVRGVMCKLPLPRRSGGKLATLIAICMRNLRGMRSELFLRPNAWHA
jgi:hypothetical protein